MITCSFKRNNPSIVLFCCNIVLLDKFVIDPCFLLQKQHLFIPVVTCERYITSQSQLVTIVTLRRIDAPVWTTTNTGDVSDVEAVVRQWDITCHNMRVEPSTCAQTGIIHIAPVIIKVFLMKYFSNVVCPVLLIILFLFYKQKPHKCTQIGKLKPTIHEMDNP